MPGYAVRLTHHVNADDAHAALTATLNAISTGSVSFEVTPADLLTPSGKGDVTVPPTARDTPSDTAQTTGRRRRRRTPASLITLPERSVISTDLYASPEGEEDCVYNDFVFSLGAGPINNGYADTVGFWPGSYATGVVVGPADERLTMTMSLIDQARLAGWDVSIIDCSDATVSEFEGYAAYPRVSLDTEESERRAQLHSLSTLAASRTSTGPGRPPVLVVIAGLSHWIDDPYRTTSSPEKIAAVVGHLITSGPNAGIHTVISDDTLSEDAAGAIAGKVGFAAINSVESSLSGTAPLIEAAGMDVSAVEDTVSRLVSPQPAGLFMRLTEGEYAALAPFAVYSPAAEGPARLPVAGQESQWEDVRRLLDRVDSLG